MQTSHSEVFAGCLMESWYPINKLPKIVLIGVALFSLLLSVSTANAAVNYSTGNWVWDEALGLNTTYIWNAQSFSGFYYDLDSGIGSEELEIRSIDRNLGVGEIIYTAEPFYTDFKHDEWGSYQVIGFLGDEYFAGYPDGAVEEAIDNVSFIEEGVLAQVLRDTDDKESAYSGSSFVLEGGYALNIVEVDINGSTVWIQLEKDGDVVDDDFLSSNDDYIYEADLGDVKDVPLIIVHIGTVFAGTETSAVFIEGIFQISDNYTKIIPGYFFGEMEVKSISSKEILLENGNNISLDQGSNIATMGELKLRVAEDDILRFAPVREMSIPGTYELRGTVYDGNKDNVPVIWMPFNFEGFYYNIDEGVGTEQITIESLEGRVIPANKLVYNSTVCSMEFEHIEWGNFVVIGFFGEEYVPLLRMGDDIHLAKADKLSRLVIDDDKKYTLRKGESLSLGKGYALEAKQVDVDGKKVWLEFTKDGEFVDDEIISVVSGETGDWIVDLDSIEDEDDVIVMRVHVSQIFQGAVDSLAQIEGLWLIDYENAFTIENDDEYGELEVVAIGNGVAGTNPKFGYLELKNISPLSLDQNSVQQISQGMSFRIADSDTLRFYLFEKASFEGSPGFEVSLYRGDIREGDGYRLNNYVIEITDVFVEANSASYYIYERENMVEDGLLEINETVEFDFEGGGKVRMRLLSVDMGDLLPRAIVEITISNYRVSNLYVNEVTSRDIYTIPLQKGWNLVSTPLIPMNPDVNSIFGDNEDVILPVYTWSPTNKQYYTVNTVRIGKGYWVLALNDTQVTFTGTPYSWLMV